MQKIPSDVERLLQSEHEPQRAFGWPRDHWLRWFGHLAGPASALNDLPDKLDRTETTRLVQRYTATSVDAAFSVAMVWGHGYSNYGPFRTARVLTGKDKPSGQPVRSEVLDSLRQAAAFVRDAGPVEGFR